jgi:hypothetical protein
MKRKIITISSHRKPRSNFIPVVAQVNLYEWLRVRESELLAECFRSCTEAPRYFLCDGDVIDALVSNSYGGRRERNVPVRHQKMNGNSAILKIRGRK